MDKSQSAGKVVVCQVRKILTQLEARQHTLIYNVLARQRADVEVFVLNTALNALADKIQRALEIRHTVVRNAGNKQLLYARLASQCRLAEAVGFVGTLRRYISDSPSRSISSIIMLSMSCC